MKREYGKFIKWANDNGIVIKLHEHDKIKECFEKGFESDVIRAKYHIIKRLENMFMHDDERENCDFFGRMLASNKTKVTLETMINKWGVKEGTKKFNEYCAKQAETNTFEYKNKKYGMSKEEFDKYNASRAVTKKNLICRHGEEEGLRMWEEYRARQAYAGCAEEYFIKKYGEEKGKSEYKRVNRAKTHSVDAIMETHECDRNQAIKILKERHKWFRSMYSQISQRLFDAISERLPEWSGVMRYAERPNGEYGLFSERRNSFVFFDFTIPEIGFCIEFNGDYYHANPKKYKSNDVVKQWKHGEDKLASWIWKWDWQKNQDLIDKGFRLCIVWESDYREDPEGVVDRCVEEIQEWLRGYEDVI